MSEKNFNFAERVLDNSNLSLHLRALFGVSLVLAVGFILVGICYFVSTFVISPAYIMGVIGFGCWYYIFYQLCKWSDGVKEKSND